MHMGGSEDDVEDGNHKMEVGRRPEVPLARKIKDRFGKPPRHKQRMELAAAAANLSQGEPRRGTHVPAAEVHVAT